MLPKETLYANRAVVKKATVLEYPKVIIGLCCGSVIRCTFTLNGSIGGYEGTCVDILSGLSRYTRFMEVVSR